MAANATQQVKEIPDDRSDVQQKYIEELESRNREFERADRLKSEFLANMSHEIRSPLHTIIGFAALLREEKIGGLNEKQRRFVTYIHNDSLHLLDLINDLLDLSKIEAGRLELRTEAFRIGAVVEEAVESIRSRATEKSIEIKVDAAAKVSVLADRVRVRQILNNLLSNAVKFTANGGKIRIEWAARNGRAEISISDTGIGIPEDQQALIFDKFYQLRALTSRSHEGTGLGLAITKKLVEQHGGSIWLKSGPREGSRFTFTMPLG